MAKIKVETYESTQTRGGGEGDRPSSRPQPHRFRVRASNGEIIAMGEAYVNRGDRDGTVRTMFDAATEVTLVHEDGTEERLR